jgi:hypothetical protein
MGRLGLDATSARALLDEAGGVIGRVVDDLAVE